MTIRDAYWIITDQVPGTVDKADMETATKLATKALELLIEIDDNLKATQDSYLCCPCANGGFLKAAGVKHCRSILSDQIKKIENEVETTF